MDKDFTLENVVLSTKCSHCGGTGGRRYNEAGNSVRCSPCSGSGHMLTVAGRKIMNLVFDHALSIREDLDSMTDPFSRWREGSGTTLPEVQHCR